MRSLLELLTIEEKTVANVERIDTERKKVFDRRNEVKAYPVEGDLRTNELARLDDEISQLTNRRVALLCDLQDTRTRIRDYFNVIVNGAEET